MTSNDTSLVHHMVHRGIALVHRGENLDGALQVEQGWVPVEVHA
jgi:hypothetical protein